MPLVFGLSFFFALLVALNLAMFIGKEDLAFGTIAGFMTGLGWVTLGIAVIALFENRPLKYVLINGGYMTVSTDCDVHFVDDRGLPFDTRCYEKFGVLTSS